MAVLLSQAKLVFHLKLFQEARKILAEHFLHEEPDIYTPSFKYEQSPEQMNLAREKYFCRWLHTHWILFEQALQETQDASLIHDELQNSFSTVFLEFLKKYELYETTHHQSSEIFRDTIHERIQILKEILQMGDYSEERLKQLQYVYERDNVLFERKLKSIKEV